MFIHCVFFWLHPATDSSTDSSTDQDFVEALHGLLRIPSIAQGFVGPPAATRDAVIDHTYHHGLTLLFADQAAHDAYQIHPLHSAFVARFTPRFAKVQVFDMEG